jgi:hypothetical protein
MRTTRHFRRNWYERVERVGVVDGCGCPRWCCVLAVNKIPIHGDGWELRANVWVAGAATSAAVAFEAFSKQTSGMFVPQSA